MEYVRTAAPVLVQLLGPDEAGHLLRLTGKLIGMQYFDEVARCLSSDGGDAGAFAAFLHALRGTMSVAEWTVPEGATLRLDGVSGRLAATAEPEGYALLAEILQT